MERPIMLNANEMHAHLEKVRHGSPLVHNITNYVVMNFTANALLAVGASPVMAHAAEEVEEMAGIAGSLVVNIGTLSRPWVDAMIKAMRKAKSRKIPIVLDPVGVGATQFRNETAEFLLREGMPSIIRGNASEIMALQKVGAKTKGVDSTQASEAAIESARALSKAYGVVVCVSGATDYLIRGDDIVGIRNGDPLMTKVTGMGCAASALIGAFAAVCESEFEAVQSAMATMGIAGEKAAKSVRGPGSLAIDFLDTLYRLGPVDFAQSLNIETR